MSKRAVFGITETRKQADEIVSELQAKGFKHKDISVLYSDKAKQLANADSTQTDTMAPEGAAIGASAGTAIGGAIGLLAGIGALAIPGIGPLIAAGPLLATLGGLGVGAAVGGLAGSLVGFGIPEHHARAYEARLQEGGILIAAHCENASELSIATDVLTENDATDIVTSFDSNVPATGRRFDTGNISPSRR